MVCKICGQNVADGTKVCDFCGSPIKSEYIPQEKPTESSAPFKTNSYTERFGGQASTDTMSAPGDTGEQGGAMDFGFGTSDSATGETQTTTKKTKTSQTTPEFDMFSDFGNEQTKTTSEPVSGRPKKKLNNNNTTIYILIATVVVLVCVVVTMLLVNILKKDDNDEFVSDETQIYSEESPEEFNEIEDEPDINEIDSYEITKIISKYTDYTDFGIYVKNLDNGYEYDYNGDSTFLASAMGQVVILDTLSRTVDDKDINVNSEYVYFDYIPNGKEAPTSKNEDGKKISLKKCIEDVSVFGDNNKSNHIVDYIGDQYNTSNGFDVINRVLYQNGYNNTSINRKTFIDPKLVDNSVSPNMTSPKEIANIFENLVNRSSFGSESYMKGIFKSVSNDGKAIGFKKYISSHYDVCNVNALTNQATNNVAVIGYDGREIVVSILSNTAESKVGVEGNDIREKAISDLINYIVSTQFEM